MKRRVRSVLCAALSLAACECADDGAPAPGHPPLIFDTNVRKAYQEVRACRSPGEHSALNAFTVWVNDIGASTFSSIWETPPAATAMTDGSIVVKEIYTSDACDPKSVDHWVAMKKEVGFDPANGDWYWQKVEATGEIISEGRDSGCSGCHAGGSNSCAGYGLEAGRDYLCTAP